MVALGVVVWAYADTTSGMLMIGMIVHLAMILGLQAQQRWTRGPSDSVRQFIKRERDIMPRSTTTTTATTSRARKSVAAAATSKSRTVTVPATLKKPTITTLDNGVTALLVKNKDTGKSTTFKEAAQIGVVPTVVVTYLTNEGLHELAASNGVEVGQIAGVEVTIRPIVAG